METCTEPLNSIYSNADSVVTVKGREFVLTTIVSNLECVAKYVKNVGQPCHGLQETVQMLFRESDRQHVSKDTAAVGEKQKGAQLMSPFLV